MTGPSWLWVLYCIPVIGFIAAGVVSLLGIGTFAIYLVERYRSNAPRPLPADDRDRRDGKFWRPCHGIPLALPRA